MIQRLLHWILRFIAPPHCFYCRAFLATDAVLCSACLALVKPIVSAHLVVAGTSVPVFAVSAYKGPVKRLILAKGYRDALACHHLGNLMVQRTAVAQLDVDCIVPVPLHWTRFVWRGYNQAEEIAQVLARHLGKPIYTSVTRARKTRYQAELSADARIKNVRNVFAVTESKQEYFVGKHVLVIDDLMTTGSTLSEVAKVLLKSGARKVSVVVAARVV